MKAEWQTGQHTQRDTKVCLSRFFKILQLVFAFLCVFDVCVFEYGCPRVIANIQRSKDNPVSRFSTVRSQA